MTYWITKHWEREGLIEVEGEEAPMGYLSTANGLFAPREWFHTRGAAEDHVRYILAPRRVAQLEVQSGIKAIVDQWGLR